ncbi:hypothetical protein KFE25_006302 [Diacronema lutheri]|nr:hypothetical protein KFE25_006302 [Diacronema lutheri]
MGGAPASRPVVARSRPIAMSDTMVALGLTQEEIAEGEDWTATIAELAGPMIDEKVDMAPVRPYVNKQAMQAALEQWRVHENDVGSTQVQIARLSERIKYLTEHQARNKKDKATERGLVKLANHRRKLLKFLIEDDLEVFEKITAAYGIRTRKIVEESMGVVRRDKSRSNGAMN